MHTCTHDIKGALEAFPQAHTLIQVFRLSNFQNNLNVVEMDAAPIYITSHCTEWKNDLVYLLAKQYGCSVLLQTSHREPSPLRKRKPNTTLNYFLVGPIDNIKVCRTLYLWFFDIIEQDAAEKMKGKGLHLITQYCNEAISLLLNAMIAAQHQVSKKYNCILLHNKEARRYAERFQIEASREPKFIKEVSL